MKTIKAFSVFFIFVLCVACAPKEVITGADRSDLYLPLLKGKKVGVLCNQTAIVGPGKTHLVDFLLARGVDLRCAFAPEHGFRGNIERGEKVDNCVDAKTGLPIYSLYGGKVRADSVIAGLDILIFDIQDVGARFYTYITSMHKLMQMCADHDKPLLILDRPNPCGDQVDGPVRKSDVFKSGVSFHKIAMVHGLTVAELAQMINGEHWLREPGQRCELIIIPLRHYTHSTLYELPVTPSPSLPNYLSVRLYSSLCLFEGTEFNIGRGTDYPFQVIGYPDLRMGSFHFTPGTKSGMEKHVENKGMECYGMDLRSLDPKKVKFTLKYLLEFYRRSKDIPHFNFFTRSSFFNLLAGNDELQQQIKDGLTEEQIRASWKDDLDAYKIMRKKYLIYPE